MRARLDKAYERSRKTYNLRHRDVRFDIGQRVWKRNYAISDASKYFSAKLAPKFVGPFVISKVVSPWTYELQDFDGKLKGTWNVKHLKPDNTTDDDLGNR